MKKRLLPAHYWPTLSENEQQISEDCFTEQKSFPLLLCIYLCSKHFWVEVKIGLRQAFQYQTLQFDITHWNLHQMIFLSSESMVDSQCVKAAE